MASRVFFGCHDHLRDDAPPAGGGSAAIAVAVAAGASSTCPNDTLRVEKSGAGLLVGTRADCEVAKLLLPPSVASATGPAPAGRAAGSRVGGDGPAESALNPPFREVSSWETAVVRAGGEDAAMEDVGVRPISDPNAAAKSEADGIPTASPPCCEPPAAMSAASASVIRLLSMSVGSMPSRDCRPSGSTAGAAADAAVDGDSSSASCEEAMGSSAVEIAEAELTCESRETNSRPPPGPPLPLPEDGESSIVWDGMLMAAGVLWGSAAGLAALAGSLQSGQAKG